MTNETWWEKAVFYELYIDKVSGTFLGLIEKLDYYKKLGVTCFHILPIFPSPMVDDGYDVSNYMAVRQELGTLDDFKKLIDAAHSKGIRILIDLVLNHVSSAHPWFVDARASKDSPYRNYFIWSETKEELKDSVNEFPHLKPDNWIRNEATNDFYFTTFYAEQPDLNWKEPAVMKEITDVMDFWINLGVDAFRLDAVTHLIKMDGTRSVGLPETHQVLKKLRAHLDTNGHTDIAFLGEVNDRYERAIEYFGNGDECHMIYNFPLAALILLATKRNTPEILSDISNKMLSVPKGCQWVTFLRNHDELVMPGLTNEEKEELLTYGDETGIFYFRSLHGVSTRLATFFEKEPEKIRQAFLTLLSLPGSPVIYYGEEIGQKNDTTIGEQKDTRRYIRGTFNWEEATAQEKDSNSLLSFITSEIQRRQEKEQGT